jgi:hypothetical protein
MFAAMHAAEVKAALQDYGLNFPNPINQLQ